MAMAKRMYKCVKVSKTVVALEQQECKEYLAERQTVSDKQAKICAWEEKIADLQNRMQTTTDPKYIKRCNEIVADLRFSIARAQEYIRSQTR